MPQPTRHHRHLQKGAKDWTILKFASIGVGTKRVSIANWFTDVCHCVVQGNHRSTCVHHYNVPWFVKNSWAMEVLHLWLGQFSKNTLVLWRLLHKIRCSYEFQILQQWFHWILGCFNFFFSCIIHVLTAEQCDIYNFEGQCLWLWAFEDLWHHFCS